MKLPTRGRGADRQATAVRNNAAWCETVCRAVGLATTVDEDLWTVQGAPPPFYPAAVTLRPDVVVGRVLTAVADRPTAGVKDSFAGLDMYRHGFHELFAARWIHRPAAPAPADTGGWTVVRSPTELAAWADACESSGTFDPALLDADGVHFLAHYDDGRIGAGAILNLAAEAVGVSNVFATAPPADRISPYASPWPAIVASAGRIFPGRPLVGYEHGADLDAARSAGFSDVGALRIWVRDS
ncbi:MAG: hypothetical protein ABJA87_06115 [bacterium]